MIRDKVLQGIFKDVSEQTGIPLEVVDLAYREFWNFTKGVFEGIPVKELKSRQDYENYRTSVNIKGLGKLHLAWEKIQASRDHFNYKQKLANENTQRAQDEEHKVTRN